MDLRQRLVRYSGFQVLRYGIVGAAGSLLYVGLTTLLAEATTWSPVAASIAAFALTLPAAYFGHFGLTFRRARVHGQAARFVLAMSNAFTVSTVAMWLAVDVARVHYAYALAATTVIVTAINYAVLDNWVFPAPSTSLRAGAGPKPGVHDD